MHTLAQRLQSWRERPQAPIASARRQWLAQLAMLLSSGIALHPALGLLQLQQPVPQQRWWQPVLNGIEQGQSLSYSLSQKMVFSEADIALLGMAEQTGRLNEQLSRLVHAQQRRQSLKHEVQRAIRYPLVVLAGALMVSAYLLTQVVPSFAELYASFDAELPWLTQRVMNLSTWVANYGLYLLATLTLISGTIGAVPLALAFAINRPTHASACPGSMASRTLRNAKCRPIVCRCARLHRQPHWAVAIK